MNLILFFSEIEALLMWPQLVHFANKLCSVLMVNHHYEPLELFGEDA